MPGCGSKRDVLERTTLRYIRSQVHIAKEKKIMLMYVSRVYTSVCAMMCTSKSCPVIKSGKLTAHDSNHHRVIWALILFKPISFTSCNCKLKTAFILNAQWSDKLHSSRYFNDNLLEVPNWYHKVEEWRCGVKWIKKSIS